MQMNHTQNLQLSHPAVMERSEAALLRTRETTLVEMQDFVHIKSVSEAQALTWLKN